MSKINWDLLITEETKKEYFKSIFKYIEKESKEYNIFPKKEEIFTAFRLTPYNNVKAVIIGQDPYHGEGQAHGLAFSVKENVKIPPSLRNIFKELKNDLNIENNQTGNLTKWAEEGVLLLNSILTVREGKANSHKNIGWEVFSNKVIKLLNESNNPICFILWGNYAKSKENLITNPIHLILKGTHPSPLSAHSGFFGNKYFSKTNIFLIKNNLNPINWSLI